MTCFTRFLLLTLLLMPMAHVQAQVAHTDTSAHQWSARQAFDDYLEAYNSADRQKLEEFVERYEYDETVETLLAHREATGGFDLLDIEIDSPKLVIAHLRWRSGQMYENRRITTIGDGPGPGVRITGNNLPIARLDMEDALAGLADRAATLEEQDMFSGTILVARHGEVLFEKAYGMADREQQIPTSLDTRLRYASVGKMFTSVALLQLVDEGKVHLDGTVSDYIPDYPNQDFARNVKVRHLLTHEAGAGDIDAIDPDWQGDRSTFKTLDDYLNAYGNRAPDFEPGSKGQYSNNGFMLLGSIIEAVTGQNFHDVIQAKIFDPSGMTRSGYEPETVAVENRPPPYRKIDGKWTNILEDYPWRGTPAGGGYSTVRDLYKFATALQSGKLISDGLFRQAIKPQNKEGWYGFGFVTFESDGQWQYGHGGGAPGSSSWLYVYPDSGYITAALSNLDPPAAYDALNWFAPRMPVD